VKAREGQACVVAPQRADPHGALAIEGPVHSLLLSTTERRQPPTEETNMAEKKEERAPARFDPFRDLDRLVRGRFGERMGSPLSGWIDEFFGERAFPGRGVTAPLDITESDDRYTVTVELPGVAKDDVTVDVQDRVVSIRGEKKSEREEKKEKSHWIERSYGSFSRSFTLPTDAVDDRLEASFKDGVLKLSIPRAEKPKPRTVSIKS
jgi:HSP20 family protein